MTKKKRKTLVFATTLEKDKNKSPDKVWDKIVKETIEKKHGKIK